MAASAQETASPSQPSGDLWSLLSAPLSRSDIEWRADGKPSTNSYGTSQRFVPYTNAQAVLRRLDSVARGEWNVEIAELPTLTIDGKQVVAVKSCVSVLGVSREDIGQGDDYKGAASDAFKRAAVRFGIGSELYGIGTVWVKVEPTGQWPKPLEDPYDAWQRSLGKPAPAAPVSVQRANAAAPVVQPLPASFTASDDGLLDPEPVTTANMGKLHPDDATCPKCGNGVWDNRVGKKNPKAPDFKCKDKECDGCIWPPKTAKGETDPYLPAGAPRPAAAVPAHIVDALDLDEEELPF